MSRQDFKQQIRHNPVRANDEQLVWRCKRDWNRREVSLSHLNLWPCLTDHPNHPNQQGLDCALFLG